MNLCLKILKISRRTPRGHRQSRADNPHSNWGHDYVQCFQLTLHLSDISASKSPLTVRQNWRINKLIAGHLSSERINISCFGGTQHSQMQHYILNFNTSFSTSTQHSQLQHNILNFNTTSSTSTQHSQLHNILNFNTTFSTSTQHSQLQHNILNFNTTFSTSTSFKSLPASSRCAVIKEKPSGQTFWRGNIEAHKLCT